MPNTARSMSRAGRKGVRPAAKLPEVGPRLDPRQRPGRHGSRRSTATTSPWRGLASLPGCSGEGRRGEVDLSTRITAAVTGPDGVATFDWLPDNKEDLTFLAACRRLRPPSRRMEGRRNRDGSSQDEPHRGHPRPGRPPRRLARPGHRGPRFWNGQGVGPRPGPDSHGRRRVVRDEGRRGRGLLRLCRRQRLGCAVPPRRRRSREEAGRPSRLRAHTGDRHPWDGHGRPRQPACPRPGDPAR